jgi:hypothetical protein
VAGERRETGAMGGAEEGKSTSMSWKFVEASMLLLAAWAFPKLRHARISFFGFIDAIAFAVSKPIPAPTVRSGVGEKKGRARKF